ncbi:MAG TPA: hypothetical protein VMM77_04605 [Gemmatimonadaceae bacterium]|nr:hypothetical protein [Gemmatimonadaceae bacterium]
MRKILMALVLVALAGACAERHLQGVVGLPGGDGWARVQVRVEDDPAGAEPVTTGGSRPTVAIRFAVDLIRTNSTASVPDTGALVAQATIGTVPGDLVTTLDTVPAGGYISARLTLTQATLAMPGVAPIDLLGGATSLSITRNVAHTIVAGETVTIRLDLNSDAWLVPNPVVGPGQPEFAFTGTTDFLAALTLSFP